MTRQSYHGRAMLESPYMNTKQRGIYRFIAFRENDSYIAVCLDLNIVERGEDLIELKRSIEENAHAYISMVRSQNLPDSFLNQSAPKKYFKVLEKIGRVTNLENNTIANMRNQMPIESASLSYLQYNFA